MEEMEQQKGQIILILVLVMTVALAIGLSVVQRSLSDISTSTKVEESSRAFSAAEAGIEDALNKLPSPTLLPSISLSNSAQAQTQDSGLIPLPVPSGTPQALFEYPPLSKEEVAQVWLADPFFATNPPTAVYKGSTLDIYWGNSTTDPAALELSLVYFGRDASDPVDPLTNKYRSRKWFLVNSALGISGGGFTTVTCSGSPYLCNFTIGGAADTGGALPSAVLVLLRARLLYNTSSQPFAVQAVGTCGSDCSLPKQARILSATGTAGSTQRKVKVFQEYKVVPPYFDYAIFSVGAINK